MNKNKIIFAVIFAIVAIFIYWVMNTLSDPKTNTSNKTSTSPFVLWTYNLEKKDMDVFMTEFMSSHPEYSAVPVVTENFENWDEYIASLSSAFISGKGPDVFVLSNFEKSFLENQTLGINPTLINVDEFRKNYKPFFSLDLISSTKDGSGTLVEFLTGIPAGYETLGVFYNRKYAKASDFATWASLQAYSDSLKAKNKNIIPIGIGNGSNIVDSQDIITQLFLLDSEKNTYKEVSGNAVNSAFDTYISYGPKKDSQDPYDSKYYSMIDEGNNNLDFFIDGEIAAIIGYPSMIKTIAQKGFSKNYLYAEPFPHFFEGKGKTLVKYNYFVVNKDTVNEKMSFDLLKFIDSDKGQMKYLDNFPYMFPAKVTLESDYLGKPISANFNIKISDFFNNGDESTLASFNKGLISVYDKSIISILDSRNYASSFQSMGKIIECKYNKLFYFQGLSISCK